MNVFKTKACLAILSLLFLFVNFETFAQKKPESDCIITGNSSPSLHQTTQYCSNDIPANAYNLTWVAYGNLTIIGANDQTCVNVKTTGCGSGLLELTYCLGNLPSSQSTTLDLAAERCCNRCIKEINVPISECCGIECPQNCEGSLGIADCHEGEGLVAIYLNSSDCYQGIVSEDWQVWGGTFTINGQNTYSGANPNDLWVYANEYSSAVVTVQVTLNYGHGCDPIIIKDTWNFHELGCWDDGPGSGGIGLIDGGNSQINNHDEFEHQIIKSISPNPSSSETILKLSLKEKTKVIIDIVDLNGKTISNIASNETLSKGEHDLKIVTQKHHLTRGVYFITIKTDNGRIETSKLVIK